MPHLNDDEEEEDGGEVSDDDNDADADLREDMEALRRACLLTGGSPGDFDSAKDDEYESAKSEDDGAVPLRKERSCSFVTAASTSRSASASRDGDSDSEDDLELLRKVQRRFCDSVDSCEAAMYLNRSSVGPAAFEDDEMDDFETLCAVRNRFAAYDANKLGVVLSEPGSDGNLGSEPLVEEEDVDEARGKELVPSYSSFPEEAHLLVNAIKKNRSCQKLLRSKIAHIEARMEENRKLVERVKILKDFQVRCKKFTGEAFSLEQDPRIQLITARKNLSSKDSMLSAKCKGPAENAHVAKYRSAVPQFPLSWKQKPWSKIERENLNKGLRRLFKEMLLQVSVDQSSESEGSPVDPSNLDDIASSIRHLEITPERIREFIPKVNWDQLASLYVPDRSGAECEARWLNFEDPLINQNPWTKEEEKLILLIVQERGMTNWIDIAASLGTNRTPFDCLAHFQRSLNANILRREWTSEEDDQLRAAVQMFGESNWQSVAATLPGRTGTQCSNRWLKSIHPSQSRKGRWTVDEDKRLKVAVKLFGPKNWEKIAQFIPGRMQSQCRERWVNSLDPSLKRGEWTEEEDSKLKSGIEEFGHRWSKIAAKYLPHRTDNSCLRRWKALFPDDVRLVQAARRTKKAALRSNFVDYEEDRPALGLSDFIPLPMITSGTEPRNTVPAKRCKRREPRNMVPAKRCKRRSREPNSSTVEENGGVYVAPGKTKMKLRPRRPKKVDVSSEDARAVVSCTEVENMCSYNDMPILSAQDVNAETCPHPILNGISEETFSHHPGPMQTTQENAGELSLVHLISCEPINFEQHVPQGVASEDCGHESDGIALGSSVQKHIEGDDHQESCDPGVANGIDSEKSERSEKMDGALPHATLFYSRKKRRTTPI